MGGWPRKLIYSLLNMPMGIRGGGAQRMAGVAISPLAPDVCTPEIINQSKQGTLSQGHLDFEPLLNINRGCRDRRQAGLGSHPLFSFVSQSRVWTLRALPSLGAQSSQESSVFWDNLKVERMLRPQEPRGYPAQWTLDEHTGEEPCSRSLTLWP